MPATAQIAATGTIEGRVFDAGRGEYLERVRLTLEGTAQEVFSDAGGFYRFGSVPVGAARVKAFFTGLAPQTTTVNVAGGQTAVHDIAMSVEAAKPASAGGPIKLTEFVVSTSKEMDGAAIAINEQRFARNIMNVVAADEFGLVVDGTPGEVMKFLPGISMDYSAGEARTVSINGVPSSSVPITVGGFDLASAASNGNGRNINLDQFSVNNISRVEVNHSPTPESPGNALAGSVNMVPRSAFERSRPSYSASAFIMMKDGEKDWKKTAGPLHEPTRKITPGFNFSAVVPVNKRFGFTLSANNADQYSYEDVAVMTWRGAGNATTVAANATNGLPATTPDNPYLTDFAVRDSTRDNRTDSVGMTADYKVSQYDTVSLSFQWTWIGVLHNNRTFTFLAQRVLPGQWGPTYTHGAPGGFGRVNIQGSAQDWYGTTSSPSVIWRHNGRIWRSELGLGMSRASLHVRSADKGWFRAAQASRTGVTVSFDDIFYLRPGRITVTDAAGAPVDVYNLNNYSLVNADDNPRESLDSRRSAFANLRRDFAIGRIPVSLKGGLDVRSTVRDLRGGTTTYAYVGPDKRASTTPVGNDDVAAPLQDVLFSQRDGRYGLPSIPWLDNQKYYERYKARPDYFTIDQNAAYRSATGISKHAEEVISSAYIRGDVAFMERRLQLVGGLRAEQTNVKGEGPLTDPTRAYQRDSAGNVVRNAAGQPVLTVPTNAGLPYSLLTYIDRGQLTEKEYLRLFPNINASYNVRENLIARASWYMSVGRPSFDQYAGGLTLPDTQQLPSNGNRISVNNPGIKAWQAKTMKVRLEYYFQRVGQVSVGAFRRDIENFFGSTVFRATPEFLALSDLDPDTYGDYDVATNYNLPGTVRMTGLEFDYKQALTFLPNWARGVQVFANMSALRAQGQSVSSNFNYIPRTYNWGVSFTRPKYLAKMSWNYRGKQRRGAPLTGLSVEESTFDWGAKRLYVDLSAEYRFLKNYTLFGNMRNIGGTTEDLKRYGPSTPDYAKFRQRIDYGSAWTFGVKGAW